MNGSYSVPTGSRRSPNNSWARPAAPSSRNRFISAMPSSICWPWGEKCHFWALGMRWRWKISAISSAANSARRFTQPPRLVETVTSGEVVTMRRARSVSVLAIASMIRPKAVWVEVVAGVAVAPVACGPIAGTGAAVRRRLAPVLNGTRSRKSRSAASSMPSPSNGAHSWPGRTPMASRSAWICASVIWPEWLSLWPASGVPQPLTV